MDSVPLEDRVCRTEAKLHRPASAGTSETCQVATEEQHTSETTACWSRLLSDPRTQKATATEKGSRAQETGTVSLRHVAMASSYLTQQPGESSPDAHLTTSLPCLAPDHDHPPAPRVGPRRPRPAL